MEEENIPQEDNDEVEAHHKMAKGAEDPERVALSDEDEDDEVEAHRFRSAGPDEPGRRC